MNRYLTSFLVTLLPCCTGDAGTPAPVPAAPAVAPTTPHTVTVFATASLRQPFARIARAYEQQHPGAKVELRCEGGSRLLAAALEGAACDVVAIGDSSLMSRFAGAALLAPGSATELGRNRIALAVATAARDKVHTLADFGRADLRLALGARSSSIGRHARWVLSRLKIDPKPAVEADSADGVLAAVAEGLADAGIVYTTSFVATTPGVTRVDVPEADNTPVLYSIATVREAKEPAGAAAFRAFALGSTGQQILRECGFLPIGSKAP